MCYKNGGIHMKRLPRYLFTSFIVTLVSALVVLISVFIYNHISNLKYSSNDLLINDKISSIDNSFDVVKSFIELDASFNTSDAINKVDEAQKFLTEDCFERTYLNNGRFMSLPDNADLPVIRFIDNVKESNENGYKIMVLWNETLKDKVYTYTGVFNLDKSCKIASFRKIPHLK